MVLGHVKDIVLETEGQSAMQYEVGGLVGKKYLISREQVINFSENKMIVEDNVIRIESKIEIEKANIDVSPVTMRSESN